MSAPPEVKPLNLGRPGPRPAPEPLSVPETSLTGEALLKEMRLTERLRNLFWLVLTALIASGITFSAIRYYDATKSADAAAMGGSDAQIAVEPLPPLAERFLAEDFASIRPRAPSPGAAPFDTTWIQQAALSVVRAERARELQRPVEALEFFKEALRIFPDLRGVHRQTAMIHLGQGRFPEAARDFEKACAEDPAHPGLWNNLGLALIQTGDTERALQSLRKAVELRPGHTQSHYNLALLLARSDDFRGAADHFTRYLQAVPNDTEALQRLAGAWLAAGDTAQARKALERAVQVQPAFPGPRLRLAQLESRVGRAAECVAQLRAVQAVTDPRRLRGWMADPVFDPVRGTADFNELAREAEALATPRDPAKPAGTP